MPTTSSREVGTRHGPARLLLDEATEPLLELVLGHGAGGGPGAPDLLALASALPRLGITVVRVEQPWRLAGRRVAPAPVRLDESWLDALAEHLGTAERHAPADGVPLVVGGRSAGARVACRTAAMLGAHGVLALAFPLHPPGRPGRSRLPELLASGLPTLVVQGTRDSFGGPEDVEKALQQGVGRAVTVGGPPPVRSVVEAAAATAVPPQVLAVEGADHGFAFPRAMLGRDLPGAAATLRALEPVADAVAQWLLRLPDRASAGT